MAKRKTTKTKAKKQVQCSKCATPAVWIKTVRGKWMLCEIEGIVTEGGETICTPDGRILRNAEPGNYGNVPHWQNCKYGNNYRKGGEYGDD